jgi:DNA-binding winged helix-turn-helix (wHTH) protein
VRYTFGDCGDWVLDTRRQELWHAGGAVKLRRKVWQVLVYLLLHHDRAVSKHELLEHLWPDQFVGDEALKSCIKSLRKAFGERGRTSRFIGTVHGQGYRFVAAVIVQEPLPTDDARPALIPSEKQEEVQDVGRISRVSPAGDGRRLSGVVWCPGGP